MLLNKLRATSAHEVEDERTQHEINVLQDVKQKIDDFKLAVSSEVELISTSGHAAFLSISASHKKEFSQCAGPYHPVKLLISPTGDYEVHVNILDCAERGTVDIKNEAAIKELVFKISAKSPYKICPGLTKGGKFNDLQEKLGYVPQNVFSVSWPWNIVRHMRCSLWHIPGNARLSGVQVDQGLLDCCLNCKTLSKDLNRLIASREDRSEGHKWQRQSASSHHAIFFLSPESKKERMRNVKNERKSFKKLAQNYWDKTKIALGDSDSNELCHLVNEIDTSEAGRKELEKIFAEAEGTKEGRGMTLRELWRKEKLDFITDQQKNGNVLFEILT